MIAFSGTVWRILPADRADAPTAPVRSAEGRFHHSGQPALYASLSPEGAGVAVHRYLGDGLARVIVPLRARFTRLVDLRALPDPSRASVVWQASRAAGAPAPTWDLSDAARARAAEGMLYPSRSRPELTHLVLFDWDGARLAAASPPRPWADPRPDRRDGPPIRPA